MFTYVKTDINIEQHLNSYLWMFIFTFILSTYDVNGFTTSISSTEKTSDFLSPEQLVYIV